MPAEKAGFPISTRRPRETPYDAHEGGEPQAAVKVSLPGTHTGTWDIQVRQAGHGDMIHIPVGEDLTVGASGRGLGVRPSDFRI